MDDFFTLAVVAFFILFLFSLIGYLIVAIGICFAVIVLFSIIEMATESIAEAIGYTIIIIIAVIIILMHF